MIGYIFIYMKIKVLQNTFHSFIKKLSDLFRSYAKVVNGDRP